LMPNLGSGINFGIRVMSVSYCNPIFLLFLGFQLLLILLPIWCHLTDDRFFQK
jgi:hypothetical protein